MENPIKIDDLGGKPTIFGNIHITSQIWNNQTKFRRKSWKFQVDFKFVSVWWFRSKTTLHLYAPPVESLSCRTASDEDAAPNDRA